MKNIGLKLAALSMVLLAASPAVAGKGGSAGLIRTAIHSGSVDAITAEIERVGREQHLLALACVEFDVETLVESLSLDALVPNRDTAARLVREMVAYQSAHVGMRDEG